jgi:hypothetical protein
MTSGAVTLAGIASKIATLEVVCSRCERHGRLRGARHSFIVNIVLFIFTNPNGK